MESLISIIIPVYNSANYLRQCLDSITAQTYPHLQIICVDDHSTDCSWDILTEYAKKDSRFSIFQKSNEGVSLARNFALEKANGDYLLFVDSDDWLEPDTCQCAFNSAMQYDADVVMWSYIREMGTESRKKKLFDTDLIFEENQVRQQLYRRMAGAYGEELFQPENADALCTVWGKLYRSTLIKNNHITFHDIREIGSYEDGLFNLDIFSHVHRAVFLNRYFYHYRRNNTASLTTAYNPNLSQQWSRLFCLIQKHLDTHALDATFYEALSNRIVLSLIPLGINVMESRHGFRKKVSSIREIIRSQDYRGAISAFKTGFLPLHWKVFFTLAKWNCSVGIYLLLLVIQKIRGR